MKCVGDFKKDIYLAEIQIVAVIFTISLATLTVATVLSSIGYCKRDKRTLYGAIMYISAGRILSFLQYKLIKLFCRSVYGDSNLEVHLRGQRGNVPKNEANSGRRTLKISVLLWYTAVPNPIC